MLWALGMFHWGGGRSGVLVFCVHWIVSRGVSSQMNVVYHQRENQSFGYMILFYCSMLGLGWYSVCSPGLGWALAGWKPHADVLPQNQLCCRPIGRTGFADR